MGPQYRSWIGYHTDAQKATAEAVMAKVGHACLRCPWPACAAQGMQGAPLCAGAVCTRAPIHLLWFCCASPLPVTVLAQVAAQQWWGAAPLTTELKPLEVFYAAEDHHQNYFVENPRQPYCQVCAHAQEAGWHAAACCGQPPHSAGQRYAYIPAIKQSQRIANTHYVHGLPPCMLRSLWLPPRFKSSAASSWRSSWREAHTMHQCMPGVAAATCMPPPAAAGIDLCSIDGCPSISTPLSVACNLFATKHCVQWAGAMAQLASHAASQAKAQTELQTAGRTPFRKAFFANPLLANGSENSRCFSNWSRWQPWQRALAPPVNARLATLAAYMLAFSSNFPLVSPSGTAVTAGARIIITTTPPSSPEPDMMMHQRAVLAALVALVAAASVQGVPITQEYQHSAGMCWPAAAS